MLREIILDTETTGLDPLSGDRIVEIGCIELINYVATENVFHEYLNPEREVPEEAFKVHGLSTEFLSNQLLFPNIADKFLSFISNSTLIIHNSSFDIGFINAELARTKLKPLNNPVIDTIQLARKKFPGSSVSLDSLCKRFEIDSAHRAFHGALLDANLLAQVYIELIGGRQTNFSLSKGYKESSFENELKRNTRPARMFSLSTSEETDHREFLKKIADPLWLKLEPTNDSEIN